MTGSNQQPEKHPDFVFLTHEPMNGSPPMPFLVQEFITPVDLFFIRNHGTVPQINPDDFRLTIDGLVNKPLELTFDALRQFPHVEVMATLQCAGNRRQELIDIAPIPDEIAWGGAAISTAVWGGIRLRDVLIAAGFDRKARHIAFSGVDEVERKEDTFGFGGSIPVEKALMPETLLVYEMNGEPLTPVHGYPLRVVVPGYIGARSVKWLTRITAQSEPSSNYFQRKAYKLFSPNATPESVDWEHDGIMMGENSLNAVICYPGDNDTLAPGEISVMGYALGDGYNQIEKVEVSGDSGRSWSRATFLTDNQDLWAWRLWEARLQIDITTTHIVARATDTAGNSQPRDTQEIWNFKGYGNNAWHRLKVQVRI